ncbi:flagellar basal-body MS-ring/collar protein FliF [Paenibacillus sp. MBLB4367]|uniref:flagellar basal-body MS-ring/collar protein FliF n=1 Tax=Paenibacillus sp. MBLB4367 TaxID=3384767 RepID=UPI00390801BA
MNETMLQYWNRTKQYWNKFTKTQKITLATTLVLIIFTIGIVTYSLSRTEYVVAFRDLQPTDASAIKQYLDNSKVPYHLSPDGKSIEVPANKAAELTVDVASQGLMRNGSLGYGAFREDKPFGMSDREFEVKHLDAIQGELQQLINANAAVSGSKVLITLPEKSVFVRSGEKELSSAAVVVNMKPGFELDQKQIDTMYSLVSKGVKSLPPENITITNQYGDLLPYSKASSTGMESGDIALQQFQIKKQLEQDVQKSVMSLLGPVLGAGKVVPMAVASINFDKKTTQRSNVEPVVDTKGIEISVQEIQKSYSSDGNAQGGIPGTGTTDVPNYPASAGSGKANSEEMQKTVNYEVNRIKTEVQSSPFVLSDLSISVGIEPPDRNDPNSLTQQTKDAVQRILVNIVKASLANSDKRYTEEDFTTRVTVFEHNFASPVGGTDAKATNWWLYGGIGAIALALAAAGGYMVSRRKRKAAEAMLADADIPAKLEYPTIDIENVSNESQVRKQLESLAKKKPEEFVNLLRTWLVDE